MSVEKSNNRRTRNWCAVVYPESAPQNWKSYLDTLNIKWACSPLHDKDTDDDGQLKKAHWHIVLCYNGNKSFEQVIEDLQPVNCPRPQICRDVRGSVRYFIHKDHPHKFQYKQSEIECFNGFDIGDVLKLTTSEKHEIFKEIFYFICEWDIQEYFDLINYTLSPECKNESWFQCVTDNSMLFERYLKSNRHRPRMQGVDDDGVVDE